MNTRAMAILRSAGIRAIVLLAALTIVVGGGGCGGTKTQPIPVIYGPGKVDPTSRVPESLRTNDVKVFYATNRGAKGPADNRKYNNDMGDRLRLGVATVKMGDKNTTWDDISKSSLGKGSNLSFKYANATELGELESAEKNSADAFVEAINQQLKATPNHQVNIYVHGFHTAMPSELELLAKMHHFMFRGGAMVCFSWPSRQSLRLYGSDVERGKKSAHYIADLIELIASRTDAEKINVLAYSAGGAATAEALVQLRDRYTSEDADALSKRLRIGNVIFAASDIDLKTFAGNQLAWIQDLSENTIIYIAKDDAALGIASMGYGASRIGRPDFGKYKLSKEQVELAAKETTLQVVDVTNVPGPHASSGGLKGHGYWYANDRIMTDLLVILRWQILADQRGLVQKPGMARWFFPKDYPARVYEAVHKLAAQPATAPTTREAAARAAD
jgi:esterase/lipase superfamily enzyme